MLQLYAITREWWIVGWCIGGILGFGACCQFRRRLLGMWVCLHCLSIITWKYRIVRSTVSSFEICMSDEIPLQRQIGVRAPFLAYKNIIHFIEFSIYSWHNITLSSLTWLNGRGICAVQSWNCVAKREQKRNRTQTWGLTFGEQDIIEKWRKKDNQKGREKNRKMAHDLDDKHDMGISRIKSESIIVQTKQDYRPWGISQFPTPKRNMSNVEHEHEHKIAIHITWHVLVSFIWCCQRAAEQVSSHWLAGNTFFFRFSFVFFFFLCWSSNLSISIGR